VYALKPNQVGVAINRPKPCLRGASGQRRPARRATPQAIPGHRITYETFYMGAMDRQQILEQWYLDLDKELGLQWTRPPAVHGIGLLTEVSTSAPI